MNVLSFLVMAAAMAAEPEGMPQRSTHARFISSELNMDGLLSETEWAPAPQGRPIRLVRNNDGGDAPLATTASLLYDRQFVYVGVHCDDPNAPEQRIPTTNPYDLDVWHEDTLEVFFDPGLTRSRYVQIVVNAAGQGIIGFNGVYERLSAVQWQVHTMPGGWSLEMKIPFDSVRARANTGDRWGFNLFRTRPRRFGASKKDEGSVPLAWRPTGGGFREPAKFGLLTFGLPFEGATSRPDGLADDTDVERRMLGEVSRDLAGQGRWKPADMSAEESATRAERLMSLSRRLMRLDEPVLIAKTPAITDLPVFPWTVPTRDLIDPTIMMAACPDEFEPASFLLFASRDLKDITVEVSKPKGPENRTLPAGAVDLRHVICWYQNGWAHITGDGRTLVPELLVHDGALFTVDPQQRENQLNWMRAADASAPSGGTDPAVASPAKQEQITASNDFPVDAKTLQPFDLPAFQTRQIWLTFRPPADAVAGLYEAEIQVKWGGRVIARAPLQLTVYPFKLLPPTLSYSLYYRLRPSQEPDPAAAMRRMAEEVRNQVEHGINMPSTYVGGEPLTPGGKTRGALEELTRIYRDLGLRDHPLILVTTSVGRQSQPEQLQHIRDMVSELAGWARPLGYSDVYLQGIDEADPKVMREERLAFEAVHEGGGKVFVACGPDYFEVAGDLLDMPVLSGSLRQDIAQKAKALGHRVFSYGNPQCGVELPATYRRNYGVRLWAAGYDGAFNYEYQGREGGKAYDDFASHWRNHTMAYPTADGPPIDTRQWEGWREAVDDMRYLATMLEATATAEKAGRHAMVVSQTRMWAMTLSGDEDPEEMRREMVSRIIVLKN